MYLRTRTLAAQYWAALLWASARMRLPGSFRKSRAVALLQGTSTTFALTRSHRGRRLPAAKDTTVGLQ